MADAKRDGNRVPAMLGTSNADGTTPIPPYVDSATNRLLVQATISGSSGDGAILDGSSSSIKATVKNYTNANPLTVRLTDTNGDYVSAGAGTQYTEDAAAASDPVGGMLIARRKDTLSATEVSADGDNIALNSTNKGQLHVKLADTVTVDGSGVTQPVSGTVSVTGVATSTKQSDGSQKTQVVDGSGM